MGKHFITLVCRDIFMSYFGFLSYFGHFLICEWCQHHLGTFLESSGAFRKGTCFFKKQDPVFSARLEYWRSVDSINTIFLCWESYVTFSWFCAKLKQMLFNMSRMTKPLYTLNIWILIWLLILPRSPFWKKHLGSLSLAFLKRSSCWTEFTFFTDLK